MHILVVRTTIILSNGVVLRLTIIAQSVLCRRVQRIVSWHALCAVSAYLLLRKRPGRLFGVSAPVCLVSAAKQQGLSL
jgi:hypothetical protein